MNVKQHSTNQPRIPKPRNGQNMEMELDAHSELDNPLLHVPTSGCPDSCLLLLFRTAIERTSCGVHKPLRTGGLPTTLTSVVLVVADGFFGLCVSERLGRATHRYRAPHPHPPKRSYVVCEDVKPYNSAPDPTPPPPTPTLTHAHS